MLRARIGAQVLPVERRASGLRILGSSRPKPANFSASDGVSANGAFGIRHPNSEDLPGAYLSLGMLPLLFPSTLVKMVKPVGCPNASCDGGLGLLGRLRVQALFESRFCRIGTSHVLACLRRWFCIHLVVAAGQAGKQLMPEDGF